MAAGEVALNVEDDLHIDGRPALVLLHGFTGSLEDFDDVAPALRRVWRVLGVDLVGHGRSEVPEDAASYTLTAMARQVATVLDVAGIRRTGVLGYSLGARVALRLALDHPERVERLVLVGATPGIEDPEERRRRAEEDAALARMLRAEGIAAFVEHWMARPFLASARTRVHPGAWAWAREDRLRRDPEGLARSLLAAGQGATEPMWEELPRVACPVRLVVGEDDGRYAAVARRMAERLPRADVAVVPGAGHAPHREAPQAFLRALLGELDDTPAR